MARTVLQRSLTFSDISTVEKEFSILRVNKESLISKAQFFCKIGMGVKPIESMSCENRKIMTAYLKEPYASEADESYNQSQMYSEVINDESSRMNQKNEVQASDSPDETNDPEYFVKCNLMKQNMLSKPQMIPRNIKTSQSLTSISSQESPLTIICQNLPGSRYPIGQENLEGSSASPENDCSINSLRKTDAQVRSCYYNRLIQMKILRLTPTKKNQSIIIFDWDDTLLCTSYLVTLGIKSLTSVTKSVLRPIDETASKLLKKSAELGNVFIITNAEEGWVQHSAQVFLPNTFAVLQEGKISVISARSQFEKEFPEDRLRWKKEAFLCLMNHYEKDVVTNIVCVGDSDGEIDAAQELGKRFQKAVTKTIKFKEQPRPEELRKQQEFMVEKFDRIFVGLKNTAIKLEKR